MESINVPRDLHKYCTLNPNEVFLYCLLATKANYKEHTEVSMSRSEFNEWIKCGVATYYSILSRLLYKGLIIKTSNNTYQICNYKGV